MKSESNAAAQGAMGGYVLGGQRDTEEERRREALKLALSHADSFASSSDIVARATVYEQYLKGE